MKKRSWKGLFIIIGILLVLLWYGFSLMQPVNPGSSEKIAFLVSARQSLSEIGKNLEEAGLIRSGFAFSLYARFKGLDREIQAGRFSLGPSLSLPEIVQTLSDPGKAELAVTFPEGFTIDEMDEKLTTMGLVERGNFVTCSKTCDFSSFSFLSGVSSLEGYLFPDTYFVFLNNFSEKELISRMLKNFEKKVTTDFRNEIKKRNKTLADIVTLASIIEKEVKTVEDYPIVSGILWKRLAAKWPLGADATLLYEKKEKFIRPEDLQSDSPYNTRRLPGLPPTPIGNPGLKTIEAAIFPQESPYWFYLTDKDGKVIYAKTNEEHNENKARHL